MWLPRFPRYEAAEPPAPVVTVAHALPSAAATTAPLTAYPPQRPRRPLPALHAYDRRRYAPYPPYSNERGERKHCIQLRAMSEASPSEASPAPPPEEISETKPSVPPKERRFKLSRACDRCRRRRIKCDEGHPCQSCLAANAACTFEEPGKRSHPHKSKRQTTLEDRMHHIELLIQSIPFNLFGAQSGQSSVSGNTSFSQQQQANADSPNPHASFASSTHAFPPGVPPPSLSLFPLMNPSTHFPTDAPSPSGSVLNGTAEPTSRPLHKNSHASVSQSYLYLDDEGYTRWQGETSGLPLLDFLVERERPPPTHPTYTQESSPSREAWSRKSEHVTTGEWFPNRQPRQTAVHPEAMWRLITSMIAPDLMDSLVQCFLSTTCYLMPFLHVPTFLADYGNPEKWGEPGFASFIVAICCLSSRHIDDIRVRADPADGFSAGVHWFDLFAKLRTVPTADRPTLYTIQSVFVAGIYAVGLGKLSRGFALLAESATLCIDAGLHRSTEAYDCFGAIEEQVRRRTFWCVYMWDKQFAAAFGRPPIIRLKDCDAPEPEAVDDEYITQDEVGQQPAQTPTRLGAFLACLRLSVILEAVLEASQASAPSSSKSSPFLARAVDLLGQSKDGHFNTPHDSDLRAEELLLDEVLRSVPAFWAHTTETMSSADVLQVTQAKRLHCLERFLRMLIQRHRFSRYVAERVHMESNGGDEGGHGLDVEHAEAEREAMLACHACAVEIAHAHSQVAKKGLMTYYGVHVIHQLSQAGRTLIAVLLNCKTEDLQPLVPQSLEALRACVALLRRFSGRYICGLRQGELIEEFCRLTHIPLDAPIHTEPHALATRPPWIRPVRKKSAAARASSESGGSRHGSPAEDGLSPAVTSPPFSNGSVMSPMTPSTSFSQDSQSGIPSFSQLDGVVGGLGVGPDTVRPPVGTSLLADLRAPAAGSSMKGTVSQPTLGNISSGLDMLGASGMGPLPMANIGLEGVGMMEGMNMNGGNFNSSALMSLLGNDGSFDMNALFSGSDFGAGPTGILPPIAELTPSNAGDKDRENSNAMVGVIASPSS